MPGKIKAKKKIGPECYRSASESSLDDDITRQKENNNRDEMPTQNPGSNQKRQN
jgi:hypothetical protein